MSQKDLDVVTAEVRRRIEANSKLKAKMIPTCFECAIAAAKIGVSERALKQMIKARAIRTHRVGGVVVISGSEIERVRR